MRLLLDDSRTAESCRALAQMSRASGDVAASIAVKIEALHPLRRGAT
ncbi:MAG: hypothetical protein QM741_05435 [Rudaea sp.]